MEKATAITHVKSVLDMYPGVDQFHVTTDGKVHIKAALAVAHAVTLSPGNPTVVDVERGELNEESGFPPVREPILQLSKGLSEQDTPTENICPQSGADFDE